MCARAENRIGKEGAAALGLHLGKLVNLTSLNLEGECRQRVLEKALPSFLMVIMMLTGCCAWCVHTQRMPLVRREWWHCAPAWASW